MAAMNIAQPDFDFHDNLSLVHEFMDSPAGRVMNAHRDYISLMMLYREDMETIIDSDERYHDDIAFLMHCMNNKDNISKDSIIKGSMLRRMKAYLSFRTRRSTPMDHDGLASTSLIAAAKHMNIGSSPKKQLSWSTIQYQIHELYQRIGDIMSDVHKHDDGGLSEKDYSMIQSYMLLIRILHAVEEQDKPIYLDSACADEAIRDYRDGLPYDFIINAYFTDKQEIGNQ